MKSIDVFVQGVPIPQGSVSPMPYMKKGGKGMGVAVFQKPVLVQWRNKIADTARPLVTEMYHKGEAVLIILEFRFLKPKSNKLVYPCNKKADLDKCVRAVGDALTGVVYDDDCQITDIHACKRYVFSEEEQGVAIKIVGLDELEEVKNGLDMSKQ